MKKIAVEKYEAGQLVSRSEVKESAGNYYSVEGYLREVQGAIATGNRRGELYADGETVTTAYEERGVCWVFVEEVKRVAV